MDIKNKKILDACCGSRMFWFQKNHPDTLYCDKRVVEKYEYYPGRYLEVKPDMICDFTNLPLKDKIFYHVIFDPPHLISAGETSYMKAKYGQLDKNTWKEDIKKGFEECMRVLKPYGTLVFKWSDSQIKVGDLLKLIPFKPLYGNQRGNTHWLVFIKEGI